MFNQQFHRWELLGLVSSQYGLEAFHSLSSRDCCSWFCSWSKHSASVWNEMLGIPQAVNIGAFFLSQGRNPSAAHSGHSLPGQDFALPSSAFPFALALIELKHPKRIISVPWDCTPHWQLLSGPSEAAALVKAPPCLPSLLWCHSLGARAH